MKNISPHNVFEQLSNAIPREFHENIIIIGSLAAGYHFFGDDKNLQVRTKDIDCLLTPRIEAIDSGKIVTSKLLEIGWKHRMEGKFGQSGNASTSDDKLPAVRLIPPDSDDWFIEFLIEPESENSIGIHWTRLELPTGHYALCSFQFLRLLTHNPIKTKFGFYYARPELMALANLLEHPEIKSERMASLFEGRAIKRSNKDLGRALAIARLSNGSIIETWPDIWEATIRSSFPKQFQSLKKNAGNGIRAILESETDFEEVVHTCNFGLLAANPVTSKQMQAVAKRLLNDAIIPFEEKFKEI